ncbi:NAD(P)-binding domain-containing protein [Campylobacter upsaliensis]|uniref:NAD(P)-binding domain-containing protein n=1 Tax=Campylobacter upsaliensis TaxID=28080 RepID=UPI001272572A|nr:NAD(P)-binding domain-containing protein [Campylobacter upsaliensis]EAI1980166.1 cbb3-type cytochrome oxidase assembly protein CcoS [Campylobacter upsaliensis]EAI5397113.1 cbb3-type cytochrome oxidase assembly protein CcoS [Campylobacter upsaliensis]EAI9052948.1 cbb3-type cytochrome oxidase assembly protein CcoS [Campylobacter upsaliensis]EAI9058098.1 cbb3-type cytochrome oxidase assembly protein CcoS [Campylobacter upsaliensis]EAJ1461354.1 cbb3-type cytochrome oxidase assembly protein CcoS
MKKLDLIIIGAGPAGIGCAVEAKLKNKELLLLEKTNSICQTLVQYYKDGKRVDKAYKGCEGTNYGHIPFEDGTKESTIACFEEALKTHNINVEFNSEVESVKKQEKGFIVQTAKEAYECDHIIIAIGRMGKPNKPEYKLPMTLTKKINFNANSVEGNEKILVVGGGNSAAEYAVDLANHNQITLCYRKKEFTRLNDINLKDIMEAGNSGKVTLKLGVDINEVLDEGGKARVHFNDNSSELYDRIIYAIGGSTPLDFLQKCGINVDEKGVPLMDENKQSNVSGIFVAGDIATKNGASIVTGLNDAFRILEHLKG